MVSCIHVLHHWSVADSEWWDKVSHFSQYPVLMVTIAAKAEDMNLKRDTGKLSSALILLVSSEKDGKTGSEINLKHL